LVCSYFNSRVRRQLLKIVRLTYTHTQLHSILWDSILLDQESLVAQEREPTLKKRPHDDHDPPNDREREKSRKRRRNTGESSSKSSKKDKAPINVVNIGHGGRYIAA
ncbi:hypothetical protein Tco_0734251, partial [Tanacetum coccineum]